MTLATSCTHRAVVDTATAPHRSTSRLAGALNWLAARIERSAELRARRKAARMSEAELQRMPAEVLEDLGVRRDNVSPLIVGLVGPPEYWRAFTGGRR